MTQDFTLRELLIKHLYHETTTTECLALECLLREDAALQAEFTAFRQMKEALQEVQLEPSDACVDAILKYSAHTELEANL